MLILTRKMGQSIIIGNDTKVTVLGFKDGHVRIGIDAPKSISVHREEVQSRIERNIPHRPKL